MHTALKEDHDELRRCMQRFAAVMQHPGPIDRGLLLRERVIFSRQFHLHVPAEQRCIQSLPTERLPAKALTAIGSYQEKLLLLQRDYSAHITRWNPGAMQRDWDGYVCAVLSLQRQLTDLMDWEEKAIFPLIAAQSRPSTMPAAA